MWHRYCNKSHQLPQTIVTARSSSAFWRVLASDNLLLFKLCGRSPGLIITKKRHVNLDLHSARSNTDIFALGFASVHRCRCLLSARILSLCSLHVILPGNIKFKAQLCGTMYRATAFWHSRSSLVYCEAPMPSLNNLHWMHVDPSGPYQTPESLCQLDLTHS